MSDTIDRRRLLRSGAAAVAAAAAGALDASPSRAMDPIPRIGAKRFKLSCAAYSLRQRLDLKKPSMTLEEFIEQCAAWGTDGVELTEYFFRKPVTPAQVLGLKHRAAIWGQDITGTPIGNNFALPPGEARAREVASVKRWIDVSADLGSPAIRIFAGGAPAGAEESEARKWVVECVEECCEHAARRGVFLAMENHGGVVATADGLLEIVKAVQCPWFGVNLDTGNFHTPDPYADLARVAPHAITCQVKTEISPAGGGKVEADLSRLVDILRKANYRGYVTLEYEAAEDPMKAVPRYLEALRKLLG